MTSDPGDRPRARASGRLVERLAIRRRARRLDRHAGSAPHPEHADTPIMLDGPSPLRVLLFGTGAPATGSGVATQEETLGARIAHELVARTARGVRFDALIAEDWQPPDPFLALQEQRLERYDAIVVISTYRRSLADVPVDRWLDHVVGVRDLIARSAAPHAAIQVLSLPWRRAAADAPDEWGGPLGGHIRTLDNLATASLDRSPDVLRLILSAPAEPSEWIGPAFSATTYRAWGAEVAAQLAPRLRPAAP